MKLRSLLLCALTAACLMGFAGIAGAKEAKAVELGLRTLDEAGFVRLLQSGSTDT